MAAPRSPMVRAADVIAWLTATAAGLDADTEAIAHGGTALTLLRLKPSTKDVDFGFRHRADLDRFSKALERQGYRLTRDFRANPREVYLRMEDPRSRIPAVDLRAPTWNNWRMTEAILSRALVLPIGRLRLVQPDREALFLFKTYPLRETDLDDLRAILRVSPPDQARVIALFDEQDAIHRSELLAETIHEPLLNILELRVRFAASLRLLGPSYRRRIPRIARRARIRFGELQLRPSLTDLIRRLRTTEGVMTWEDVMAESGDRLRERLTKGETRTRARSGTTSTRSKRRPGRPPRGD